MSEPTPPDLKNYISERELTALIHRGRFEDMGPSGLDVTSRAFIPLEQIGQAHLVAREAGRLAGLQLLPTIIEVYDDQIQYQCHVTDAQPLEPGQPIAHFQGPLLSILSMERIALNFLSHLSAIATLTSQYVTRTQGTAAHIYDTRKTLPGLRSLQKYAVACGGGENHRVGLYDAMLVKDNHLAGIPLDDLTDHLADHIRRARVMYRELKFIEIEVDTLDQFHRVLSTGCDIILLDNMTADQMRQAVALRDREAPDIKLEASGGVNLDTVQAIAQTGVDRISVGALTHSPGSIDLALDIG